MLSILIWLYHGGHFFVKRTELIRLYHGGQFIVKRTELIRLYHDGQCFVKRTELFRLYHDGQFFVKRTELIRLYHGGQFFVKRTELIRLYHDGHFLSSVLSSLGYITAVIFFTILYYIPCFDDIIYFFVSRPLAILCTIVCILCTGYANAAPNRAVCFL